jgi:hypothetical protein
MGVLFNHKEKGNYVICKKMDGTEDHHVNGRKPDPERQTHYVSLI